jgi:UDP-glucose 4-epimerase
VGIAQLTEASLGHRGTRFFLAGGAGFIGSHFVDRLLTAASIERVTIYDNFSSGRDWHFRHHLDDERLIVVRGEIADLAKLAAAMRDHEVVIHLASNPDIARSESEPALDFDAGTLLTQRVLEAMRLTSTKRILYASGSGVYGDIGENEAHEDWAPLLPISTYGASKLAGEALISAYSSMFDLSGCAFRLANVVGARQTHGVAFDFVHSLRVQSTHLRIRGDGSQSKSYLHVADAINAMLVAHLETTNRFETFNVATGDYLTVTEIADLAAEGMGLVPKDIEYQYTGGYGGWKGDVPIVRLNTDRIRRLGWTCGRDSRTAVRDSIRSILIDARANEAS